MTILYVDRPDASSTFYADLFGRKPVEASPKFVLFALDGGLMLGLWSKHTVEPAAAGAVGATEVATQVADADAVDATHAAWRRRGLEILQPPMSMEFGRTFVALDPDGHRLRVFAPAEA